MTDTAARSATLRSVLRAATADDHAALDALVLTDCGPDGLLDVPAWGDVLRALEASHRAVERIISHHDITGSGHAPKADLAAADLAALGLAPTAPPVLDCADDLAAVAGLLYVVEGSMLGARALDRLVAPEAPRAFLRAYGEGAADNWRRTLGWIQTHGSEDGSVTAAKAAFAMVSDTVARCLGGGRTGAVR